MARYFIINVCSYPCPFKIKASYQPKCIVFLSVLCLIGCWLNAPSPSAQLYLFSVITGINYLLKCKHDITITFALQCLLYSSSPITDFSIINNDHGWSRIIALRKSNNIGHKIHKAFDVMSYEHYCHCSNTR